MVTKIIPIGNSKGIRIPNAILKQLNIHDKINIEITNNCIIIQPIQENPRNFWEQSFKQMSKNKEDKLLIDDNIDLNSKNWEW